MKERSKQFEYQNSYNKEKYEKITLNLRIGEREKFKKHAISKGYKDRDFSKYIRDLIYQDMNGGGTEKTEE